jgi:anti-sigma factor RsiW
MNARHLTEEEIGQYWQRTLSPAALLAADDHLTQCPDCRKSLAHAAGATTGRAALWRALTGAEPPGSSHLCYDDLIAFVENKGSAADRQQVLQHLEICKECSAEAQDLRSFRADSQGPRLTGLAARETSGWRPFWKIPAWAGAAAVLVLAGFLGFRAYHGRTQPEPALVAQLNDAGGNIKLDSSGRLATPSPLSPGEAAQIKDALLHQRIEPSPAIAKLTSPPGTLLGETNAPSVLQLIEPLGTVTLSDQPVFRWQVVPSATYVVAIYDARYRKVAESPVLRQANWTPDRPLPRGPIYTWQLTARINGQQLRAPVPPASEARFQVLSQAEAEQLEEAQREHANSHLLLGILYARAGALDDAERELTALLAANPNSKVASELLASAQQLRHRP